MIIAAQAADALVNIDKVEASFTFYYLDDGYIASVPGREAILTYNSSWKPSAAAVTAP